MLEKIELELELAHTLFGKKTPAFAKKQFENIISNLEKEEKIDLNNPPLINKYSDHTNWLKAVEAINLPQDYTEMHVHIFKETSKEALFLVWARNELAEEQHNDCIESILLLEGSCDFIVGNNITHYDAGTYIQVPDMDHTVKVTSEIPLKFIVQRIFAAA